MEAVVGLLVMLLRVSHGVETYCDGRPKLTRCYGALGGTVVLRLMDSAAERFTFRKKQEIIFSWRKNSTDYNYIENRSVFTPSNGTLRINNLSRTDTDVYKLTIYGSDGKLSEERTLHLTFQTPLSSVLLVSECLSQGEMRVSCFTLEGGCPQYNWTLDGHTLTDNELLAGNHETDTITLKQCVSGRLVCSVRNRVSNSFMEKNISTCGFIFISSKWVFDPNNTLCIEPTTTPSTVADTTVDPSLICVLRAAVAVLLLILIATYFAWKKKKSKKAEGSAIARTTEDPEDSVLVEMTSAAFEL